MFIISLKIHFGCLFQITRESFLHNQELNSTQKKIKGKIQLKFQNKDVILHFQNTSFRYEINSLKGNSKIVKMKN